MAGVLSFLLVVTAVFLIILVLIQKGKGGGLAGAFGGMGGQSAFGTKAGDLFTRITIGLATFWIILCMASVKLLGMRHDSPLQMGQQQAGQNAPAQPGKQQPGNASPQTPGTQPESAPASPKTPGK